MKNVTQNRREAENGFRALQESSLASDAKSHVSEAFYDDYVMNLVEYRAKKLADKCGIPQEQEDIGQDMLTAILKAAKKYDSSKASEHTFVDRVLRNFSKDYIKRHYRAKDKQPEVEYINYDSIDTDIRFAVYDSNPAQIEERQAFQDQIAAVVESLPVELKEVCEALLEKSNKREIARDLNIDHKTLYRRIEKVKKVFIENGLESLFQKNRKKEGHIFKNGKCNK